jgi:hypothetical protein
MSSLLIEAFEQVHQGFLETRPATTPYFEHWALVIAGSFLLHTLLFVFLPASPWLPKKGETPASHKGPKPYSREAESVRIRNGLVSTFHAVVCIVMVLTWYCFYTPEPWNYERNMGGGIQTPNNANGDAWFTRGTSFSVGYFLYDTLCMAYYNRWLGSVGSYMHHVSIGSALFLSIHYGTGSVYHFLFLFEELSTPALNFKNLYRDDPKKYKFWSVAFVASFYFCRGVYGLTGAVTTYWCIYQYWLAHKGQFKNPAYFEFLLVFQIIGFTTSRVLNVYWMSLVSGAPIACCIALCSPVRLLTSLHVAVDLRS